MINRRNIYHVLAHWLLWLYPAAWRDRYGEEMAAVLRLHPVSLWTIITSTGAIAVAVANSQLNVRLLRFTMLPATLATAAISVGLLVTVVLVLLSRREATELGVSDFLGACLILLMGGGAALAITALRRGLTHASRPTGNAANE